MVGNRENDIVSAKRACNSYELFSTEGSHYEVLCRSPAGWCRRGDGDRGFGCAVGSGEEEKDEGAGARYLRGAGLLDEVQLRQRLPSHGLDLREKVDFGRHYASLREAVLPGGLL